MDNRDPSKAYNSRIKEIESITGFVSSLIGDKNSGLTKLVTENLQAEAKAQAGAFIADQKIQDVPLTEQPRWRELNPRARDEVLRLEGQRSTLLAGQIYNAEISSRPILFEPSEGNPELEARQATARAEAMAAARDKSGFGALPPGLQMENAPLLMQVTYQTDGAIYKGRAANADQQRQATDVNLISSAIEKFESVSAAYESPEVRRGQLRLILQGQADRLSRDYPTAQVSNLLSRAIAEQLPGLIESADDRNLALSDLKALTSQEILVNGENIWDVADDKGKSLRLRLNEAIQAAGGQRDSRIVGLATQEALELSQKGDVDGAIDTIISAGLNVSDPANVKLITEAFGTIRLQTTTAQNGAQMEFWNRKVQGESWISMWPEIVQAGKDQGVSAAFVAAIGRKIESGQEDGGGAKTAAAINTAYAQLKNRGELGLAENQVLRAASKVGAGQQLQKSLLLQLKGRYAEIVEEKVKADPTYDIAGNMVEDLKEATAFLVDGLAGGLGSEVYRSTVGPEKAAAALTAFRQGAASTSGRLTDALFTEEVTELARTISGNDTPTIKDKTKALVNLLTSVQNPDGTPLYPNREAAVKVVREALNSGQKDPGPAWKNYGEFNFQSDYSAPTLNEAEKILKEAGVEQKEDGTNAEEVGTVLTETSLRSLGGSLDPEAKLLNPEGYQALAGALVNGRTVGLDTPLPQLDPQTPARIIPAFFGGQNDEMFVAIGIAEGTRTPDGGYTRAWNGHTDPGDGHMNRGTVSGGRGNRLSPLQVDRQWRGILAQTATNVRPMLRQIGLEPGTVAYNNVLFSALDLRVQAPAAVAGYLQNIAASQDFTLEGIAKARADAFINPQTGRLDTTFSSYTVLLRDQRSRAGALQFRRRV